MTWWDCVPLQLQWSTIKGKHSGKRQVLECVSQDQRARTLRLTNNRTGWNPTKTRQRHTLTAASIEQNESWLLNKKHESYAVSEKLGVLHSLDYHLFFFSPTLNTTDGNTFSFMKFRKSQAEVKVGEAGWEKVGSPINANYNTLSWSALNFKYWLYSGTAALYFKI